MISNTWAGKLLWGMFLAIITGRARGHLEWPWQSTKKEPTNAD